MQRSLWDSPNMKQTGCALFLIFLAVIGGLFYKSCAPQSGFRSRWGGKCVELETPEDCAQIIMLGKNRATKYISYIDKDGNYKMKEYSDYKLLEAEYMVKSPKQEKEDER